jgi:inorganic triphosphatase YgiF
VAANRPEQDGKEIELKLGFDPRDTDAIVAHPILTGAVHAPQVRELISIYYDTSDDALRAAGVFLRVRATGDGYVQTIKTARGAGEFLERDEWECRLASHEPDFDAAAGTALEPLLTPEVRAALGPRFHTRFRRRAYHVEYDGAEIETAVDQGEITAGVKATPICELELELKAGDRRAIFALARHLAETVPLTLGVKTKAERGFELLDDGEYAFEKARPVEVTHGMTCAEAFRAIARNCLRQVLVNAPAMRGGRPEALHQMRVGMRRLRAAITLFGDVVADQNREAIKGALKWLGGELGPARDLDVFAADILEPQRAAHPDNPDLEALYRDFMTRRADAYARAAEAGGSARFRAALLDLGAWIEIGDWAGNALAEDPVPAYAAGRLSKLRRAIKKKGKKLRGLSVGERHDLRIRAKRLRYATEFFTGTFTGKKSAKRQKKSLVALQCLQDALGALNDMATRQALLTVDGKEIRLAAPGDAGAEEKKWLKEAEDAYERFVDVKPFWKA